MTIYKYYKESDLSVEKGIMNIMQLFSEIVFK